MKALEALSLELPPRLTGGGHRTGNEAKGGAVPRLSIRRKLALALAVPLTALVVLTVGEVAKTAREADEVGDQTELAKSAIGPSGIITALQNERTWLGVELIGQERAVNVPARGYEETRAQTDAAIDSFRDEVARRNRVVGEAYGPALEGLEQALDEVRADIDTRSGPHDLSNIEFVDGIYARYTGLIEPFFEGTSRVALVIDDPELRQGADLADAMARQVETISLLLNNTIRDATVSEGGIDQPDEIATIAMLRSDFRRYAAILRNPTGPYARLADDLFPEAFTARVNEQVDAALSTGRVDLPQLLAAVDVPDDEGYTGYMRALHAMIAERADQVRSAADARQIWFGALAAVALLGAIALTLLVSRSITRPLRLLTGQAKDMAEHRLPNAVLDVLETPLGDDVRVPHIDSVAIRTRDEVADVAIALNTVQESALDLAVEQAVLRRNIADSFVNLGRRNQNLLGRQLDFITELESNETDSGTLASLFRLEHLATRMRRNAESLLVLAGIEPPRKWAAPVSLTDVVRAALGEVEDYHRVTVRGVEPATVVGSLAADLAHLIAELLENALTFSPPDESVEVRGHHSIGGAYELVIVDSGLGMAPDELEQANRRLAGAESFTVAPSKYLGHYVAGNLAARHGIALRLDPAPGHGITACLALPPGLLAADAVAPQGHRPTERLTEMAPAATLPSEPVPPPMPLPAPLPSSRPTGQPPQPPIIPTRPLRLTGPPGAVVGDDLLAALNGHVARMRDRELGGASRGSAVMPGPRGLARRIPGAQLPTTEPMRLHRGEPAPVTGTLPVPASNSPHVPRRGAPVDRRSAAGDVYGLLTNFTTGVQRGLDEARESNLPPSTPA